MDLNKRGSVKSAMMKSVFNNSQPPAVTKTATCQRTYKSSKKVVTSSGSKVAVFESEAEGLVTSETIGDETTTESEYSQAERYSELEREEGAEDLAKLMSEEMEKFMNAPMRLMLTSEEEGDVFADSSAACQFGVCPEGAPCQCLDDCEVELENTEDTTEVEKQN